MGPVQGVCSRHEQSLTEPPGRPHQGLPPSRWGQAPTRTQDRSARIVLMAQRVLIVDDHAGFRSAARALLESEGVDVVGEAVDGDDAIAATDRLHPSLVLLDIQLPGEDGFAVARRLASLVDPPVVVLISSRTAREVRAGLADTPAAGFLPKDELSAAAIDALLG